MQQQRGVVTVLGYFPTSSQAKRAQETLEGDAMVDEVVKTMKAEGGTV